MKKIITIALMFMSFITVAQTKYEVDAINAINQIRQDPQSLIMYIDSLKKNMPNYTNQKTKESYIQAYDETIEFIKTQKPVGELKFNKEIYNDISKYNFVGKHTGLHYFENIVGGDCKDAYNDVVKLIVDKNWKDKGHRTTLFKEDIKYVSVKTFEYQDIKYAVEDFQ